MVVVSIIVVVVVGGAVGAVGGVCSKLNEKIDKKINKTCNFPIAKFRYNLKLKFNFLVLLYPPGCCRSLSKLAIKVLIAYMIDEFENFATFLSYFKYLLTSLINQTCKDENCVILVDDKMRNCIKGS